MKKHILPWTIIFVLALAIPSSAIFTLQGTPQTGVVYLNSDANTTLAAEVAAIGPAPTNLIIMPGIWPVSSLVIPKNINLAIYPGAILNVTGAMTINGGVKAGLYQIFSCTGTGKVTFGPKSTPALYPHWWGAQADGATDDGVAIGAAAAACSSTGVKRLVFPQGTYRIWSVGQTYKNICDFSNIEGLQVIGYGAYLECDPARTFSAEWGALFSFTNCKNITVDGFKFKGHTALDITGSSGFSGVDFVRLWQGSNGVTMPYNEVENTVGGLIIARKYTDPDSYISKDINIGILKATNSIYGINCQWSGNNLTCQQLITDTIARSYFVYGVKNHKVNLVSKDPYLSDCIVGTAKGFGCEDMEITYENLQTTASSDNSNRVAIGWGDQTPATLRNLKFHLNTVYGVSGQTGSNALLIQKLDNSGNADTIDRGHKLENLTVSGYVEGQPHYTGGYLTGMNQSCLWGVSGTPDVFSNIKLENLKLNSTKKSGWFIRALADNLTLLNVVSSANMVIWGNPSGAYALPHNAGKVTALSCSIPNLWSTYGDTADLGILLLDTRSDLTATAADMGKTWGNAAAIGTVTVTLPTAVRGLEMSFVRMASQTFRVGPAGSEVIRGGGVGKYLSLDSDGAFVVLKCFTTGQWEIVSKSGSTSFEP